MKIVSGKKKIKKNRIFMVTMGKRDREKKK